MSLVSSLSEKFLSDYFNFKLVKTVGNEPCGFDYMGKKRVCFYVFMVLLLVQIIRCLYDSL